MSVGRTKHHVEHIDKEWRHETPLQTSEAQDLRSYRRNPATDPAKARSAASRRMPASRMGKANAERGRSNRGNSVRSSDPLSRGNSIFIPFSLSIVTRMPPLPPDSLDR